MRGKEIRIDCSSSFCYGGNDCIYCTNDKMKRSHCFFKNNSGSDYTHRVSLSDGFREWQRLNKSTYEALWKEAMTNKEQKNESVYEQIARYKKICENALKPNSYIFFCFNFCLFAVVYCLTMFS